MDDQTGKADISLFLTPVDTKQPINGDVICTRVCFVLFFACHGVNVDTRVNEDEHFTGVYLHFRCFLCEL